MTPLQIAAEKNRRSGKPKATYEAGGRKYRATTPGKDVNDAGYLRPSQIKPMAADKAPAAPSTAATQAAANAIGFGTSPAKASPAPRMREPVNPSRTSKASAPKMREPANPPRGDSSSARAALSSLTTNSGLKLPKQDSRLLAAVKRAEPGVTAAVKSAAAAVGLGIKSALKADASRIFKTRNGPAQPKLREPVNPPRRKPRYKTGGSF